ncbi:MAG: hypothetical protein IT258_21250 [Saprospiraceae bacterium]|nr:hypothetical protein [Saprospiraceae bacterium]
MKHKHIRPIALLFLLPLLGAQANAQTGVSIKPRVYLQAALHGLSPAATLMRDDLRKQGLVPMTEPYSSLANSQPSGSGGGETISDPAILQVAGSNAIVDWVVVELRSTLDLSQVLATRAALLQRDGDVVDVDGASAVNFPQTPAGEYFVVIDHRIHLGVMTELPVQLSSTPKSLDFTDPNLALQCGAYAMANLGAKRALWGGDLNNDGRFIFQGPGNEVLKLFTTVLYDQANTQLSANYISKGYLMADANMDGKAIYSGQNNDRAVLMQFFTSHPGWQSGGDWVLLECIP